MASSAANPTADELKTAMKEILKESDLSSLSSKKVRKQLEENFGQELSSRKEELDQVLMELVSQLEGDRSSGGEDSGEEEGGPRTSNGGNRKKEEEEEDEDGGSSSNSDTSFTKEPPKKKKKMHKAATSKQDDSDEDDESVARKLQEKELGFRPRGRKAVTEKVKKPKEKGSGGGTKRVSIYSQKCVLSEELAAVMGTDKMARKDVVSGMWKIFKERQLQDPKNKQFVNCDEQLEKVFKVKKFRAFGMMKFLKKHIKDERLVTS